MVLSVLHKATSSPCSLQPTTAEQPTMQVYCCFIYYSSDLATCQEHPSSKLHAGVPDSLEGLPQEYLQASLRAVLPFILNRSLSPRAFIAAHETRQKGYFDFLRGCFHHNDRSYLGPWKGSSDGAQINSSAATN